MKKQELELQVREIIADMLHQDISIVKPESLVRNELGSDSLEEIELVMDLEIEFDISISDDESEDLKTVRDYVNIVAEKLNIKE